MGDVNVRSSLQVGKGIRHIIEERSGAAFGPNGLRFALSTSARGTSASRIPGTGTHQSFSASGTLVEGTSRLRAIPVTPEIDERAVPRTGLLAPGAERAFRAALVAHLRHEHAAAATILEQIDARHAASLGVRFLLGATYARLGRHAEAALLLEHVVRADDRLPDDLARRYVPPLAEIAVPITERMALSAGFDSLGAALILADAYQQQGRGGEAIELLHRIHNLLPDDVALRLVIAGLMYENDDFRGIAQMARDVDNADDVTLAILHLKAKGLANLGFIGPAAEVLSECLRNTTPRDRDLLLEIRYNRAEAYELLGRMPAARADWLAIAAQHPSYRDVRERLRSVETRW